MGIKQSLKNIFWGEYLISEYHVLMCKIMPKLINDEKAVKKFYKKKCGKELDLDNPKTFSEKINWYKLNDRNPLMEKCADKVAVREYIKEKGYGDCLNEVYGVYNKVEDIDIDSLPDQFVIKAAHGSHMNYIVKDKKSFNWKHAKKMMKSWLKQDIYWSGREWVYKDMPKRIIVEKYLEDDNGELRDYKFFCFNGNPAYMQVDIGRYREHYRNYYDIYKNLLDCYDSEKLPPISNIDFPVEDSLFHTMIDMCRDLANPFQQVRVDLYTIGRKVYFGELTFFDGGGAAFYYPEQWNYKIAESWIISTKKEQSN